MKHVAFTGLLLSLLLFLTACGDQPTPEAPPAEPVPNYTVEMEIQDYGTITLELDGTAAPITVANFVKLAQEGFYDGLTFHRVMPGFMIQGGDPLGTGFGGADETIKGEFKENGVDNPLSHTRGAISMARAKDNDSASSQFFIVHDDAAAPSLDGKYAAFGYVTEGMEVVDAICDQMTALGYSESVDPADQPVITAVRVLE
ncbi:MAG: peptidylprolyl isomerase [Firmicutes bacterium]|nr:peptidylprolyl isomerase [Bacillota bacterium]